MNKCINCEHFKIICVPMEKYEPGEAVCMKHNLTVDWFTRRTLNRLTCVEENGIEEISE